MNNTRDRNFVVKYQAPKGGWLPPSRNAHGVCFMLWFFARKCPLRLGTFTMMNQLANPRRPHISRGVPGTSCRGVISCTTKNNNIDFNSICQILFFTIIEKYFYQPLRICWSEARSDERIASERF